MNCIRFATFSETDIRIRPVGPLLSSQNGNPELVYAQQGTLIMELITLMVLCFGVTPRLRLYFSALGDAEGSAYTLLPSAGGVSPLVSKGTLL